jgi:hypothetical protein
MQFKLLRGSQESAYLKLSLPIPVEFKCVPEAFTYVVKWDGESVVPLLDAIRCARDGGGQVLQDYLRSAIADLSRIPMPLDIPHYVSTPILAADRQGKLLIGIEGHESVAEISTIRKAMLRFDNEIVSGKL